MHADLKGDFKKITETSANCLKPVAQYLDAGEETSISTVTRK